MAKFLISIILACLAGACYIATGNSDTIVCSNKANTCYLLQENSILGTSATKNKVRQKKEIYLHKDKPAYSFSQIDEDGTKTISFGGKIHPNFVCEKEITKVKTNNGTEERTKYLLTTTRDTNYRGGVLQEYGSAALCELDLQVVENYLRSDVTEPLKYKRPTNYLNFLWYIGTAIFALLAILILFAKVSFGEAPQVENLSEEQKQAINNVCNKVKGVTDFISKFDSDTAKKISDVADNIKNFKIDDDTK